MLAATGRPEASLMAIAIHRPARVVIVTLNSESQKYAERLEEVRQVAGMDSVHSQTADITEFTSQPPSADWPCPLHADLTGGNTQMKVMLSDWSRAHRVSRTCIEVPRQDLMKTVLVRIDQ